LTTRRREIVLFLSIALCAFTNACGDTGPTPPSSAAPGSLVGQWSGTTSQGRPVTFVVSADQKVTAITVGYSFNGCSGVNTFSSLALDIATTGQTPFPPRGETMPGRPAFFYASGTPDGPNHLQLYGSFPSSTTAGGYAFFGEYQGCGTAVGIWNASRR
jgi:hypothetical protein